MWKTITIYLTALLCLGHVAYAKSLSGKSVAVLAVKQAIALHLKGKEKDSKDFLDYAMARDKNSRDALLFQAKLSKSMTIKNSLTKDDQKRLKDYLAYAGKTGRNDLIKLMHYVLLSKIEPENEDVLIAIARAENKNIDVDYQSLHEKIFKSKQTTTSKVASKKIKVKSRIDRVPYSSSMLDKAISYVKSHDLNRLEGMLKDTPSLSKRGTKDGLLHWAANRGHVDTLQMILEYGGNIDHINTSKNSPLIVAALWGRMDAVKFLLEHGARTHFVNAKGLTAEQYARDKGHHEVAQYIKNFKSKK